MWSSVAQLEVHSACSARIVASAHTLHAYTHELLWIKPSTERDIVIHYILNVFCNDQNLISRITKSQIKSHFIGHIHMVSTC